MTLITYFWSLFLLEIIHHYRKAHSTNEQNCFRLNVQKRQIFNPTITRIMSNWPIFHKHYTYRSVANKWGIGNDATHSWTVTGDLLRFGILIGCKSEFDPEVDGPASSLWLTTKSVSSLIRLAVSSKEMSSLNIWQTSSVSSSKM